MFPRRSFPERKAPSESDKELKPETMMGDGNRVAAVEFKTRVCKPFLPA